MAGASAVVREAVAGTGAAATVRRIRPIVPSSRVSWLRADTAVAQFLRFVLTGGGTSLVQFGVFLLLAGSGEQFANLVGVVVSSVLANEVHRRLTFRAGDRVSWLAAQWEGGALSAAALAASGLALALLGDVVSDDWWARILLIASVNAVVGLIRFLLLREWVFTADRTPARSACRRCPRVTSARSVGRQRVTRRHLASDHPASRRQRQARRSGRSCRRLYPNRGVAS